MNSITDLSARAVSVITTIQTYLLKGAIANKEAEKKLSIFTINTDEFLKTMYKYINNDELDKITDYKKLDKDSFGTRAIELVWVSEKTPDVSYAIKYALNIGKAVTEWIQNSDLIKSSKVSDYSAKYLTSDASPETLDETYGRFPTPFIWREVIREILYDHPEERLKLATVLQYMPIRVMLAVGAWKYESREQRILQLWQIDEDGSKKILLTKKEAAFYDNFIHNVKKSHIEELLVNDDKLFQTLKHEKVSYSFETVFKEELEEIKRSRYWKEREEYVTNNTATSPPKGSDAKFEDPFRKAREMDLFALALSGGGIRSATFNLGILQGLAKYNLLKQFDYLSTVSGGGYIGSWFATWIKRDQSFVKVTNRLCPDKSPEPSSEELKPIKWLRMFSNYFAPDASIMSIDAWTIIVTWIRNTLLNQVMIFLLLLGLLFTGHFLFVLWDISDLEEYNQTAMILWSTGLLIPVSVLAGLGMHAYRKKGLPLVAFAKNKTALISILIWVIGFIGALLISSWMSSDGGMHISYISKLTVLFPAGVVASICLLIPAAIGRYDNCAIEHILPGKPIYIRRIWAIIIILIYAVVAAAVGWLCLALMWSLLEKIDMSSNNFIYDYKNEIQFIVGVPMALEVFSIVIIVRMALLGKYFPDERREWWGRMGGNVHRLAFFWLCISASALLGESLVEKIFNSWWAGVSATGGWIVLVTGAVKTAFSSKTSGKQTNGNTSTYLNLVSLIGPYVFILGLLVFLPGLISPILSKEYSIVTYVFKNSSEQVYNLVTDDRFQIVLLILIISGVLFFLTWRIGVNEFSMHHFYKNRLVRAYLGASRRSTNRQITSNPFTGFDMLDDEKLHTMLNSFGYHGPYPVLNTALNASDVVELDRQDRKAESFIFSPLYCGFDFSMIKASADGSKKSYDYGYRQTQDYAYADGGPTIGSAMAISGAAVNPNQGYHSSPATAFLLTVFNLQMGWWIGNPRQGKWQRSDPKFGLAYIIYNLIGKTSTRKNYVALSDGGHFDNMGLYEMVRRRCEHIVVCDAEQDTDFTCEGFASAIRRCRVDFGAEINIDISKIVGRTDNKYSKVHFAIGDIKYPDIEPLTGKILYVKSSITGDESVDVYEYSKKKNTFPQQTTADQFFNEDQFESYRKLGLHITTEMMKDNSVRDFFGLPALPSKSKPLVF